MKEQMRLFLSIALPAGMRTLIASPASHGRLGYTQLCTVLIPSLHYVPCAASLLLPGASGKNFYFGSCFCAKRLTEETKGHERRRKKIKEVLKQLVQEHRKIHQHYSLCYIFHIFLVGEKKNQIVTQKNVKAKSFFPLPVVVFLMLSVSCASGACYGKTHTTIFPF